MTYLLLQTFLLLLSAYFLGAFLACLLKRVTTRRAELAAVAPRPAAPVRAAAPVAPARPRNIEPIQPKIDILPRPEPKAAPAQTLSDASRFDRALTVEDANPGIPRKPVVEIRPAVLKSTTDSLSRRSLQLRLAPAPAPARRYNRPKQQRPFPRQRPHRPSSRLQLRTHRCRLAPLQRQPPPLLPPYPQPELQPLRCHGQRRRHPHLLRRPKSPGRRLQSRRVLQHRLFKLRRHNQLHKTPLAATTCSVFAPSIPMSSAGCRVLACAASMT